jgi:membrane protein YqaA with SNARE-associated domain
VPGMAYWARRDTLVDRLALRLGLYGGLLAFVSAALLAYNTDPTFQTRTPPQVLQVALMWFGFTALVGGVVGWAVWMVWSQRSLERNASRSEATASVTDANRLSALGIEQPAAGSGALGDEDVAALADAPAERTAQAIRGSLQE